MTPKCFHKHLLRIMTFSYIFKFVIVSKISGNSPISFPLQSPFRFLPRAPPNVSRDVMNDSHQWGTLSPQVRLPNLRGDNLCILTSLTKMLLQLFIAAEPWPLCLKPCLQSPHCGRWVSSSSHVLYYLCCLDGFLLSFAGGLLFFFFSIVLPGCVFLLFFV